MQLKVALTTLALAFLAGCVSMQSNPAGEVLVVGYIRSEGVQEITRGTSLANVMNKAGCIPQSKLSILYVRRTENGTNQLLTLRPESSVAFTDLPLFRLADGDIIEVPVRQIAPVARGGVVVKDRYYIHSVGPSD